MSSAVGFRLAPAWTIAALGLMGVACASGGGGAGLPSVTPPAASAPAAAGSPSAASAGAPSTSSSSSPSDPAPGADHESQPGADAEAPSSSAGEEGPARSESGAAEGGSPEADPGAEADSAASGAPGDARTSEEKREELDGELRESLSEFDRLLLREQEKLAERAASAPPPGSAGAGGMGGGVGGMGGESGGEAGGQGDDGADGDESTTGDSSDFSTSEAPEHRAESAAGGEDEAGQRGRVPADVGSGNDDDIVARQLREAAMAEEDPELREKLWDEYRAYKGLPRRAGVDEAGEDDER